MINLWLIVREDVETDDLKLGRILTHPDMAHIEAVMNHETLAGKVWTLYSAYIQPTQSSKNSIKNWLDNHTTDVVVGGAWKMDGLQVGTERDEEGSITGTPLFPIDLRLIKFMPDDVTYDVDGNETGRTPATELKQVNLLAGQVPRKFT